MVARIQVRNQAIDSAMTGGSFEIEWDDEGASPLPLAEL